MYLQREDNQMCLFDDIQKYYFKDEQDAEKGFYEIVSNYIKFYHFRALRNQYVFYIMSGIKIIAVASIPVFQVMEILSAEWAAGASAVSLIMEGFIALLHVQDKWHLYRSTNNALLKEQREYITRIGKYSNNQIDVFKLYVGNVEALIGDEGKKWFLTIKDNIEKNE